MAGHARTLMTLGADRIVKPMNVAEAAFYLRVFADSASSAWGAAPHGRANLWLFVPC